MVIRPGEEFRSFIVRLESTYRLLITHSVELPKKVRGWFLLRKMHLDQTQEAMILTATQGSLDYKAVVSAIHAMFPNGKGQVVKAKDRDVFLAAEKSDGEEEHGGDPSEVYEALQGVADQVQGQSDYDSEDAVEVFETYRDIRRRVQEKKMGRGFTSKTQSEAGKWNITGSIRAKVEALKGKTRCHLCKQLGHWKKECPERRRKEQQRKPREAPSSSSDVHFSELRIGGHDAFVAEPLLTTVTTDTCGVQGESTATPLSKGGGAGRRDHWLVTKECIVRVHAKARRAMFTPFSSVDLPCSLEDLAGHRITEVQFDDGSCKVFTDDYKKSDNPTSLLPKKWKGQTKFLLKPSQAYDQGPGDQVARPKQSEFLPGLDAKEIEVWEATVLKTRKGGGEPTVPAQDGTHPVFEDGATASLYSHAVPDTACRKTLVGEYTLRGMERIVQSRGYQVYRRAEVNQFRFGNAGELASHEVAVIPVFLGSTPVVIHAAVLPGVGGKTPLLLSKELLKWLGVRMDMNADEIEFSRLGERVCLGTTERGHYAVPLFSGRPKPSQVSSPAVETHTCLFGENARISSGGGRQDYRGLDEPASHGLEGDRGEPPRCLGGPSSGRAMRVPDRPGDYHECREVQTQAHSGRDLYPGQELCQVGADACHHGQGVVRAHAEASPVRPHERQAEEDSARDAARECGESTPFSQASAACPTWHRLGSRDDGDVHGHRVGGPAGDCPEQVAPSVHGDSRGAHPCAAPVPRDGSGCSFPGRSAAQCAAGLDPGHDALSESEVLLAGVQTLERLERRQEVDVLCVVLGTPCPETTQAFSPSTVSK